MIRKSAKRFFDKIMLKTEALGIDPISGPAWC